MLLAVAPVSLAFAQNDGDLPPRALPAGGLSFPPGEGLVVDELDLNLGANRAIYRYSLTHAGDTPASYRLGFKFPRLYREQVAGDPQLSNLRRLNFLDARVRRDGDRIMNIGSELDVYYGQVRISPEQPLKVAGQTLLDILDKLPIADLLATQAGGVPTDFEQNRVGIGLSFVWDELFEPGETRQIVLSYRPYSSFFRFSDMRRRVLDRTTFEDWRGAINQGFCLNYPENSNLASAFQESLEALSRPAPVNAWAQSSVIHLGDLDDAAAPVAQTLFVTVDPNLYDENSRPISTVASYSAFCGRQGDSFDPDGLIRLSRQSVPLNDALSILFLHAPSVESGVDLGESLVVRNLVEGGDCSPFNGLLIPCSDMRQLGEVEIQQLSIESLMRAQLEIYARRGSYFSDPNIQTYFERFSWYEPYTNDPPLSEIERRNARTIERVRIAKVLEDGASLRDDFFAIGPQIPTEQAAPEPLVPETVTPVEQTDGEDGQN